MRAYSFSIHIIKDIVKDLSSTQDGRKKKKCLFPTINITISRMQLQIDISDRIRPKKNTTGYSPDAHVKNLSSELAFYKSRCLQQQLLTGAITIKTSGCISPRLLTG
jgi:hypothetical protein